MNSQDMLANETFNGNFAFDKTFMLFFLALDFGQSLLSFGFDGILSGVTLALLVVLPYFLPSRGEKVDFAIWVLGRIGICVLAAGLGTLFGKSVGTILPEMFRFLPLTLLIAAAMISCYAQFYGALKLRLAK